MKISSSLVMTRSDNERLSRLVARLRAQDQFATSYLDALELELERADLVSPQAMPANVVTMNSHVELEDLDTQERLEVTLVYPVAANDNVANVSILAPAGLALLGSRENDELEWPAPMRPRRLMVKRVSYQPEANGRYDL